MTVPVYIAECAPMDLRGRLVTVNVVFITFGQFIAAIIGGIFSTNEKNGWRLVQIIFNFFVKCRSYYS